MKHKIITAESAGYCSGIRRAVQIAVTAAQKHGKVLTIGKLVHNNDAIRFLQSKNVFELADHDNLGIPFPGNSVFVIRSHGVGRNIYDKLTNHIYYDATCPYVKKIHEIVAGKSGVVIAGDKNHPEVQGIIGHAEKSFVVNSPEELSAIRHNAQYFVAQTTFNEQKWRECIKIIKKDCTNVKIFDTICNATAERQNQARELSGKCDVMFVIGSNQSSNSVKLYEICRHNCKNAFFIENAHGLLSAELKKLLTKQPVTIGITAGASVPAEIIKEVHSIMNEIKTVSLEHDDLGVPQTNEPETQSGVNESGDFDFMAEVDKTLPKKIYTGKRVKVTVERVNANEVVVDLGTKHAGYIPADEIGCEPGVTPDMILQPGQEIECIVTKVNDAEGVVYLSKKRIDSELGFEKLSAAYNEGEVLTGYVASVVNSGVIVTYEGTRIFVPASQSGVPKSGKLEELLKKTVKFKVIEISEQRKRLVGSIKAASRLENDAIKAKFWDEIEVGKRFVGEIKSMESYGVFVDLGGVDGMVHLSELTWQRARHPKEVVSIGDKLEVFVKTYDREKKRVSLCAKNPEENPWTKFMNEYEVGSVVTVTVVNTTPFGAFAQIIPGIDGLIHISQISRDRIKSVTDVLSVGQEIEVKITEIDAEKERVSISAKSLLEPEESQEQAQTEPEETPEETEAEE
jgi:4-hydroxy-3-methylbut-2-enyl diphosphate reductase